MPTTLALTRVAENILPNGESAPLFYPVGASVTCSQGDLVTLSSAEIVQAVAVSTTVAATTRVGIIAQSIPVALTEATKVQVEMLNDTDYIELPIADSSAASVAAPGGVNGTTAATKVGSQFNISRASDGTYYCDQGLTSAKTFEIAYVSNRYPAADTFVTVIGKILPANRLA